MALSPSCFADISLSVNPVDGSNSLRFDKIPDAGIVKKQEIHIRVNATEGGRYQVFQRLLEPIVNEKGDVLNLQALETQTLSNSNSSGTLYLQNGDHLSMGDQLLYSSSLGGGSDAFMIGYTLNQALVNASGSFRGRLIFTVRGMGNNFSDQVIIDVFLQTSGNLKISIRGEHHRSRIHVNSADISEKTADFVSFSFSGNSGQEIRIYQEVETLPVDTMEHELGTNVLQIDPQGQTEGLRVPGVSKLEVNKTLIYSSNKDADNFLIYFLVDANQLQGQEAGSYEGKIKYVVETDQGRQEFPFHLKCDIEPVFTLNITTPPEGVSFSHVTAFGPPQDKEVLVKVVSNLHKPYQVVQDLQTNMTNQQGKEINNKYFTLQVEILSGQTGQTNYTEFTSVQTGEYPVFSSDSAGSGSSFTLVYRLQGYPQISAGDFLAPVRLSLNQK